MSRFGSAQTLRCFNTLFGNYHLAMYTADEYLVSDACQGFFATKSPGREQMSGTARPTLSIYLNRWQFAAERSLAYEGPMWKP